MSIVGDGRVPCIDDFDVGQELGRGGFAVVYRARVRLSGLEVALKVVDKHRACELASGGGGGEGGRGLHGGGVDGMGIACARVANEVRLHWGLKHPAVVELLDFFEDERFVYMVLELCGGGDLYRRLRMVGPLSEAEAAAYMGQLLAGLVYLHGRKIMHRDLKLSNLLLSHDRRRLRIADFGLAVAFDEVDHETHTICGTPNYMAPEVQDSGYGLSADLWSAGCLFYAMVTGGAPFQGGRVGETLANARTGKYVEPDGLSPAAKDFMARMLDLDPTRRLSVEEAASHPFLSLDKSRSGVPKPDVARVPRATSGRTSSDMGRVKAVTREKVPPLAPTPVQRTVREEKRVGEGSYAMTWKGYGRDKGRAGRASLLDFPGSTVDGCVNASGIGGAGTSTITASTTIIGSERCSPNSSIIGGESFSTLRAEAVPTPATIGVRAAAAAARARRAAARAPFEGSLASGMKDVTKHPVQRDTRLTVAREQSNTHVLRYEVAYDGVESQHKDRAWSSGKVRLGKSAAAGNPEELYRSPMKGTGDIKSNSTRKLHVDSRSRAADPRGGLEPRAPVKSREHVIKTASSASIGETEAVLGPATSGQKQLADGDGKTNLRSRRSSGVRESRSEQRSPEGGSLVLESRHDVHRSANRIADSSGRGLGSYVEARRTVEPGKSGSEPNAKDYDNSALDSTADDGDERERRRLRRERSRHGLDVEGNTVDSSLGSSSMRRRTKRHVHVQPHCSIPSSMGTNKASHNILPISSANVSSSTRAVRSRRRPRPASDDDHVVGPPPPRPPLPPQPPPLPGDVSYPNAPQNTHQSHDLGSLSEVRVAASSQRRLHERCAGMEVGLGDGGDLQPLVPLSTVRVQPVSHRSGAKAAAVEVLADGRASISVGRRWLISSANGKRVWWGAGSATYTDQVSRGARDDGGRRLESLPEALRPLYRSLAGIVDALRSKTPKVVVRWERDQRGSDRHEFERRADREKRIVSCALMDNLPDPDFAVAFQDGASLSLWTRKRELRVELPCGQIRAWSVVPGSEWPDLVGDRERGAPAAGETVQDTKGYEEYLQSGRRAYCICLREETEAYRRGASFPLESVFRDRERDRVAVAHGINESTRSRSASFSDRRTARDVPSPVRKSTATPHSYGTNGADSRGASGSGRSHEPPRDRRSQVSSTDEARYRRQGDDNISRPNFAAGARVKEATEFNTVRCDSTYTRTDIGSPDRDVQSGKGSDAATRSKSNRLADRSLDGCYGSQARDARRLDSTRSSCINRPYSGNPARHTPNDEMDSFVERNTDRSTPSGANALRARSASPAARLCQQPRASERQARTISNEHCHVRDSPSDASDARCNPPRAGGSSQPSAGLEACRGDAFGGEGNVRPRRDSESRRSSSSTKSGRSDGAATIPGLGFAFRDSRGDLEVRFEDGVVIVVDADARWMRVGQARPSANAISLGDERLSHVVTYDLRKGTAVTGQSDESYASGGQEHRERRRMPREVKERMKTLPRFIPLLKRPSVEKVRRDKGSR